MSTDARHVADARRRDRHAQQGSHVRWRLRRAGQVGEVLADFSGGGGEQRGEVELGAVVRSVVHGCLRCDCLGRHGESVDLRVHGLGIAAFHRQHISDVATGWDRGPVLGEPHHADFLCASGVAETCNLVGVGIARGVMVGEDHRDLALHDGPVGLGRRLAAASAGRGDEADGPGRVHARLALDDVDPRAVGQPRQLRQVQERPRLRYRGDHPAITPPTDWAHDLSTCGRVPTDHLSSGDALCVGVGPACSNRSVLPLQHCDRFVGGGEGGIARALARSGHPPRRGRRRRHEVPHRQAEHADDRLDRATGVAVQEDSGVRADADRQRRIVVFVRRASGRPRFAVSLGRASRSRERVEHDIDGLTHGPPPASRSSLAR